MTEHISKETRDYILDQFSLNKWESVPEYLGMFPTLPSGEKEPFAVHKSLTQPGMIAFYDSVEKAEARRETIMKVGKFLTKYYSDRLTQDEIRALAERYQAEINEEGRELTFARTEDEIEEVYVNGPHSCMAKPACGHFESDVHPVRVYAAGDLAIAHIGTCSRALCWPEKKIYGRPYGNTEAARKNLETALEAQGYVYAPSKFHGAKLLRIEQDDSFVVPYLDNGFHVTDCGEYMIMDARDGILADSQSGLLNASEYCARCGDSFSPDGSNDDSLCNYCYENTTYCDSCGERVSCDETFWIESTDETLCRYCHDDRYASCDSCNESILKSDITEAGNEEFCPNCLPKNASPCEACGDWQLNTRLVVTDCGETYCSESCVSGHHDPECEECQEAQESITAGDTSENLELDLEPATLETIMASQAEREREIA